MFADASEGTPEAAFHIVNEPIEQGERIRQLVEAGYMVRTRSDAGTVEARRNDTQRREAAFASGAHIVTTDYFRPDPAMGTDYQVSLPDGGPGRCKCIVISCNRYKGPSSTVQTVLLAGTSATCRITREAEVSKVFSSR